MILNPWYNDLGVVLFLSTWDSKSSLLLSGKKLPNIFNFQLRELQAETQNKQTHLEITGDGVLSMNRYSLQANVEFSRTRGLVSGNGVIGDYYTGTIARMFIR